MRHPHWNIFEWDRADRKNGNVQHLRDHGIEPREAEECFFMSSSTLKMIVALMMSFCLMEGLIVVEG